MCGWHAIALLLLLSFSPSDIALGDTATVISGTVSDATTGKPLSGVSIAAVSATARRRTVTNSSGAYTFNGLEPETYTLSFELKGYESVSVDGLTLTIGESIVRDQRLLKALRTLGGSRVRAIGNPFNPNQVAIDYTINSQQIEAIQGKAFNTDENSLLRSLPSVTLDKSGTISIRGGFAFEAAYRYEGIDYTSPAPNLQNTLQNVSNFSLVNGLASVELVPGGGDASHGNTGTGLVSFTAKRGSYPGFLGFDSEVVSAPFHHQLGIEYGYATRNNAFSNYFSFLGQDQDFQYGKRDGFAAALLGTRGTNAASLQSNVDPNLVYFSPSYQSSRDFLDNMFVRFGRTREQSLQFFFESQAVKQDLDYGGFQGLTFPTAGNAAGLCSKTGTGSDLQRLVCQQLVPLYPTQPTSYAAVTQPDRLYSPFSTFKIEYDSTIGGSTLVRTRYYRTFTNADQELPQQGILAASFGGVRTGAATSVSHVFDGAKVKQTLEAGGEYQFDAPFGTQLQYTKFGAFTFGSNAVNSQGAVISSFGNPASLVPGSVTEDFFSPATCQQLGLAYVGQLVGGAVTQVALPCGYLARYFARLPRFPVEQSNPNAVQQIYGVYVQDHLTLGRNSRIRLSPGLRYEGYNFLIPFDPTAPPQIDAVRQQRTLEPHFGGTYQFSKNDAIRVNYGHTLSVPLPSLLGSPVSREPYAAFVHVPSFDNVTGQPARYCGIARSAMCANYADQLYWLARDYQYGAVGQNVPLHGATFNNYDFSYEHQFPSQIALKVSPFYRRGFDIVEQAADPLAINPTTGALEYGNTFYTNGGSQRSTGVEFELSREVDDGLSVLLGATFINQFSNSPPGAFLSSAGLAAGTLYHSPELSPFQTSLALTYKHAGLRINPVITANVGYPYGAGNLIAGFCNGVASIVPNTNVISGQLNAPNYVDPQNPGLCDAPNIAATRGFPEGKGAGALYSKADVNLDLTLEYTPHRLPGTFGVQFLNVFDQLYNTPVFNSCYGSIVATGIPYGNAPCNYQTTYAQGPAPTAFPTSSYQIYPNLAPFSARFYYELRL